MTAAKSVFPILFSMETRRLTTSFKGLKSSLAQLPGKLWSCRDLPNVGKLSLQRENPPISGSVNGLFRT